MNETTLPPDGLRFKLFHDFSKRKNKAANEKLLVPKELYAIQNCVLHFNNVS